MDRIKLEKQREQDISNAQKYYQANCNYTDMCYDGLLKAYISGSVDTRKHLIASLEEDLKGWKTKPNNNDPQVNVGISIAYEMLIKELKETVF